MEEEIWKETEFEGYLVSNLGRVKSLKKGERILKPQLNNCGYYRVGVPPRGKKFFVSRLVAEAFIENPDNKPCVDHINGDRIDNRAENLRWVTSSENLMNRECQNYYFNKAAKKWQVYFKIGGVRRHYGLFDTEEVAKARVEELKPQIKGEYHRKS